MRGHVQRPVQTGTVPGSSAGPQSGAYEASDRCFSHIDVSLSPSLSPKKQMKMSSGEYKKERERELPLKILGCVTVSLFQVELCLGCVGVSMCVLYTHSYKVNRVSGRGLSCAGNHCSVTRYLPLLLCAQFSESLMQRQALSPFQSSPICEC